MSDAGCKMLCGADSYMGFPVESATGEGNTLYPRGMWRREMGGAGVSSSVERVGGGGAKLTLVGRSKRSPACLAK